MSIGIINIIIIIIYIIIIIIIIISVNIMCYLHYHYYYYYCYHYYECYSSQASQRRHGGPGSVNMRARTGKELRADTESKQLLLATPIPWDPH